MSNESRESVFTNTDNRAIPSNQARKDVYAALRGIEVHGDDVDDYPYERVVSAVEQRLGEQEWSAPSIGLITREIGGLIEIVPIKGRAKKVTRVKIGFKDALSGIAQSG